MSDLVDTRTCENHRSLRFESIDEIRAELDRIAEAERDGRLQTIGNWTPGQIMAHVAAWIEYGYDGYPLGKAPWFVRLFLKMSLKKYLRKGVPRGARIPGVKDGTLGQDDMPTLDAVERLKSAFERLQSGETAPHDSPAFGPMSHDDRIQLNLRHAELHLGFLNY